MQPLGSKRLQKHPGPMEYVHQLEGQTLQVNADVIVCRCSKVSQLGKDWKADTAIDRKETICSRSFLGCSSVSVVS